MHFFYTKSISPLRMNTYNSRNEHFITKELKYALESVRKRQNSAKIYPHYIVAVQKNRKSLATRAWLDNDLTNIFKYFLSWEWGKVRIQIKTKPSGKTHFRGNYCITRYLDLPQVDLDDRLVSLAGIYIWLKILARKLMQLINTVSWVLLEYFFLWLYFI